MAGDLRAGLRTRPRRAVLLRRGLARRDAVRPRHRRAPVALEPDELAPRRHRSPPLPVQGTGRVRAGGRRLLLRPRGPRRPARAPAPARLGARGRRSVGERQVVARPCRSRPRGRGWRASGRGGMAGGALHPGASTARRAPLPADPREQRRGPDARRAARQSRARPARLGHERALPPLHRPVRGAVHALRRHGGAGGVRRGARRPPRPGRQPIACRARDPRRLLRRVRRVPVADPPDHREPGACRADGPLRAPPRHRAAGAPRRALDRCGVDRGGARRGRRGDRLAAARRACADGDVDATTAQHADARRVPRRGRRGRSHRQERGHDLRRPARRCAAPGHAPAAPPAGHSRGGQPRHQTSHVAGRARPRRGRRPAARRRLAAHGGAPAHGRRRERCDRPRGVDPHVAALSRVDRRGPREPARAAAHQPGCRGVGQPGARPRPAVPGHPARDRD